MYRVLGSVGNMEYVIWDSVGIISPYSLLRTSKLSGGEHRYGFRAQGSGCNEGRASGLRFQWGVNTGTGLRHDFQV